MTHPGEILKEIFLCEEGYEDLIAGKDRINEKTARELAKKYNTTVKFWLNLQRTYDKHKKR